jgi:hypothetical protein
MQKYPKNNKQNGQALTEYIVAAVFLMIIVWYGLVGGSVESDGSGGLWETDADHTGTGVYLDDAHPDSIATPGLVQALHKKQDDFVESIYQP